jgi:Tfp pilus assembly protein PilW
MATAKPKEKRRPSLRDERGVSIVELLVSTAMFLIVAATAMFVVMIAAKNEPRISDRNAAIQQGRTIEERFTRELRAGYNVTGATATQVTFLTYLRRGTCGSLTLPPATSPAIPCKVAYSLSGGAITRTETNPTGTATPLVSTQVSGLSNTDIFGYAPNASAAGYVSMKLVFPGGNGDDAVTLVDGADLRNG